MLVEHTFVTTMEGGPALEQAGAFLAMLGFRADTPPGLNAIQMVRGKKRPDSRKVSKLPQVVRVDFDRGRVTIGAAITPRRGKELPIYATLMTALVVGLERLLVAAEPPDAAAGEFRRIESTARNLWTTGEKVIVCLLLILFFFILLGLAVSMFK